MDQCLLMLKCVCPPASMDMYVCMYVWMDGWMDGCLRACMRAY